MSTRCQLRFVQRITSGNNDGGSEVAQRIAQVYRHSDGYPEAVLADLHRLKRLLDSTRTERGTGYAAAQFIFVSKLRTMGLYLSGDPERSLRSSEAEAVIDPRSFEHLDQPLFLLGHGVENPADGIHGDEEYLYVVEIPWVAFDEGCEWSVKVSEHDGFPRWDGPTEAAFDRAAWQYEGPLEEAVATLAAGVIDPTQP